MATIFPYEEFPLIGQMNDPIESYYKKSVIFSSDKDSNSKDNDITEPESQFTDLDEVTKLRQRLLLFYCSDLHASLLSKLKLSYSDSFNCPDSLGVHIVNHVITATPETSTLPPKPKPRSSLMAPIISDYDRYKPALTRAGCKITQGSRVQVGLEYFGTF